MSDLPQDLPLDPQGWTRHMLAHFNYGSAGGAAIYEIRDAEGRDTSIAYQYDTRKRKGKTVPAETGFHVPAAKSEVFKTWAELREAWPSILETVAGAVSSANQKGQT